MKKSQNNFLFLNQMTGPLFRELANELSSELDRTSILLTGHPDTINLDCKNNKLQIKSSFVYSRKNIVTRVCSWVAYTVHAIIKMLRSDKETIFFISSNPPILVFAVWFVSFFKKNKYICMVYDIYPDVSIKNGLLKETSLISKFWRYVNKNVYENSDAVFTLGNYMAATLMDQFDQSKTVSKEISVIPPWVDTNKIKPMSKEDNILSKKYSQDQCYTVLYSGNMGISHDIESMLEAAKKLNNRQDIKFLFIGEGAKWKYAKDFVDNHSLENTQVLKFQPEDLLPYTMSLADISLVTLDKGMEGLMVPSKVFFYMSAGSSILGICEGKNDLENIINNERCGSIASPGNVDHIVQNILSMIDDKINLNNMKKNSRTAAVNKFSKDACMCLLKQHIINSGVFNKND